MDVSQYIEIYHVGGLEALNGAVEALEGSRRTELLKALENHEFEVKWHQAPDVQDGAADGYVTGRHGV